MSLTAMNMMARRNWSGARELMTESLDGLRRGGDTRSYAVSLNCLGAIMIELDRPQEAARYLVEAIAEAKRSDDRLGEIGAAWAVSFLACRLGRHADIAVAHDAVADHLGLLERLLPATVLDDYRLAVADSAPATAARTEVGCDTPAGIWLRGWALGIATDPQRTRTRSTRAGRPSSSHRPARRCDRRTDRRTDRRRSRTTSPPANWRSWKRSRVVGPMRRSPPTSFCPPRP